DDSQSSSARIGNASSDIEIFGCLVVANMICICADGQAVKKLEIVSTETLDSAVPAVRDKQPFEVGGVEHTLGHALSADPEYSLARLEVDHLHGILIGAECGSKETPSFNVYAKMIHPSKDFGHGDGLDAPQRQLILGVNVPLSPGR